ncbi:MAG TPA: hypothetical protein VK892_16720 [Pyrinomonadaceae bacterium]|nr:hypothetical protein [Pyrinomonadaceae bacterium]
MTPLSQYFKDLRDIYNTGEYTIGGYQVIKKWLSYRESELLGRALHLSEANEVRDTAQRISAILLRNDSLDEKLLDGEGNKRFNC